MIQQLGVSPTAEHDLLAYLLNNNNEQANDMPATEATAGDRVAAIARPHHVPMIGSAIAAGRAFIPVADTLVASALSLVCCDDALPEQETAVITNTLPNGVDYTITAFMQYSSNVPPASGNRVRVKSSGKTFDEPLSIRYTTSGDPVVGENPYTTGLGRDRAYVVATDGDASHYPPSALEVWYTDDGGLSWTRPPNPVTQETVGVGHRHFEDKPSIAVSWWPNGLGTVYVACVRADLDSGRDHDVNPNELVIFRSDDGGVTFNQTAKLSRNGSSYGSYPLPDSLPQSPQIMVDQNTGSVYLFWLEWSGYYNPALPTENQSNLTNGNKIFVAKSDPSATGFFMLSSQTLSAGNFLGPNSDALPDAGGLSLLVQRSMLIIMRA